MDSSFPEVPKRLRKIITQEVEKFAKSHRLSEISQYHDLDMWVIHRDTLSAKQYGRLVRQLQISAPHKDTVPDFSEVGMLSFIPSVTYSRGGHAPSKYFFIKDAAARLLITQLAIDTLMNNPDNAAIARLIGAEIEKTWKSIQRFTKKDLELAA